MNLVHFREALLSATRGFIGTAAGLTAKVAPFVLPACVLISRDLVVLHHPRPISPGHLLILPRNRTPGLDGPLAATAESIGAMLDVVQSLSTAHFARPDDVIAVVNGGARQDVRLLHMHLIADAELAAALHAVEREQTHASNPQTIPSSPLQSVHILYRRDAIELVTLVAELQRVIAEHRLARHGYSLMTRAAQPATLHFVGDGVG